MILTQPILFIHKPNKRKFPSDIIYICHAGDVCLLLIYSHFLGASFIKLAYTFHDSSSAICRNKLISYTLFNVHVTWFTNTLREKLSSGISEPVL